MRLVSSSPRSRVLTRALFGAALAAVVVAAPGCSDGKKKSRAPAASTAATVQSQTGTAATTSATTPGGTSATGTTTSGTTLANTSGGNTTSGSAISGATSSGFSGGTGVFVDGGALLPNSTEADTGADAGDLDGDGDVDIAIAVSGAPSRVLFNEGVNGFATRAGAVPATVMAATNVRLIDVENDGDFDLVFSANFEPVRLFVNDGAGVFTFGGEFHPTNDAYTYKLAIGDADGDGYADLFLANAGQSVPSKGQNVLLLNDQQGGFAPAPAGSVPQKFDDSIDATFLDVDGDGDLDVFVANFGTSHSLLVNDGTGRYTDQSASFLPAGLTAYGTAIGAADLDRAGQVDLFVCNQGPAVNGQPPAGEANSLLLRQGAAFVDSPARLPSDAESSFGVRIIDVNGDGFLDVVISQLRGIQRLLINLQGVLVDATANFPAVNQTVTNSHGLTVGDFNGDGAPDVFFCRRGNKPWLFLNTK